MCDYINMQQYGLLLGLQAKDLQIFVWMWKLFEGWLNTYFFNL